MSQLPCK